MWHRRRPPSPRTRRVAVSRPDTAAGRTLGARGSRRSHLPERVAAPRRGRRRRAGRDPRPAGHGLCAAGRAARRSPASTRRSPAWSATPLFGPSRVLVLGPGLLDLAADPRRDHAAARRRRTRASAIALAGMLAILVGLIEIGLGLGKLGFVADLLSKEVQVGYMNGLGDHDHRRPAAEAVRLLHRRRLLPRGGAGVLRRPRPDAHRPRCVVGARRARRAARAAALHAKRPGGARRGRRRHRRVGACSTSQPTASTRSGALPQGVPAPALPVDDASDVGPLLIAARRHHAGLAHRHDRHGDELRGPPRRRGRAQPGDDRDRRGQHRGRASSRASPSRRAARAPRWPNSRAPRASSPGSSAPGSWRCCCCSSTRCWPTCRRRRSPRS